MWFTVQMNLNVGQTKDKCKHIYPGRGTLLALQLVNKDETDLECSYLKVDLCLT